MKTHTDFDRWHEEAFSGAARPFILAPSPVLAVSDLDAAAAIAAASPAWGDPLHAPPRRWRGRVVIT